MKRLIFLTIATALIFGAQAQNIEQLKQKASNGDPAAQLDLATCYERGLGVEPDSAIALQWIQQAVSQQYADAYFRLSRYYASGYFFPKDLEHAFELTKTAAEKGSVDGVARMGRCYQLGWGVTKDTVRALQLMQQAADRGGAMGLYYMAINTLDGELGVTMDEERGLYLAQQSIDKGCPFAYELLFRNQMMHSQFKKAYKTALMGAKMGEPDCEAEGFAVCLFDGKGTKKDEAKAIAGLRDLTRRFPRNGWINFRLAQCLLSAEGHTVSDSLEAMRALEKADEAGVAYAATILARILYSQDSAQAMVFFRRAAENDDSDAQYFLGMILSKSEDEAERLEGIEYYKKAVAQKHALSANDLGYLYLNNQVAEDHAFEKGIEMLEKSVEWGNTYCFLTLGDIYTELHQTEKAAANYQKAIDNGFSEGYFKMASIQTDDKAAMQWLNKGDKAGNMSCRSLLGKIYEYGLGGIKIDNKKAERYYTLSDSIPFSQYRLGVMWLNGDLGSQSEEDIQKGLAFLQKAADMGHVDAYYTLGNIYESGKPIGKPDYAKAKSYFEVLAENDIPEGQYELGYMYENGLGVEQDSVMTLHYYTLAAQNGNADAMCYLGDFYRDGRWVGGKDCDHAADLFRQAAEQGDDGGCYYMGRSYLEGCGVIQDTNLAMPWLWKAAAMNERNAMYSLGNIYNYGSNSIADSALIYYVGAAKLGHGKSARIVGDYLIRQQAYPTAVEYYHIGGKAGDDTAIVRLGECLYDGIGFKEPDLEGAYGLFRVASTYGNPEAYTKLGIMNLMGSGCTEDEGLGKAYLDTAAAKGQPTGMFYLAICYNHGIGCEADSLLALRWMQKSAEAGHIRAMNTLADWYQTGQGAPKDEAKAFELYSKAYSLGSLTALCEMGSCYEEGMGVVLNSQKAFELYKEAADQGSAEGWFRLGLCYINEISVEENLEEAFVCFQEAAKLGHAYAAYNLGQMYEKGEGVKADKKQAKKYYTAAADMGVEAAAAALNRL